MAAEKGNQYYRLRSSDGRKKTFAAPIDLSNSCDEYFDWCEENPLEEEVLFHHQGTVTRDKTKKKRPFTSIGLCIYLGISRKCLRDYENREDFLPIITRVKEIIYNQKYEGAAIGTFNANIIARDLGLSDKTEVKAEVKNSLDYSNLTDEELKIIAKINEPKS